MCVCVCVCVCVRVCVCVCVFLHEQSCGNNVKFLTYIVEMFKLWGPFSLVHNSNPKNGFSNDKTSFNSPFKIYSPCKLCMTICVTCVIDVTIFCGDKVYIFTDSDTVFNKLNIMFQKNLQILNAINVSNLLNC